MKSEPVQPSGNTPPSCQFVGTKTYFWGVGMVDPSEPEYVAGKGCPFEEPISCRTAADPGEKYCPRHKMEMEMGVAK